MAKHSPGPWEVIEYRGSQGHDCIGVSGPQLMCASVNREDGRADAQLISAAPDLLAACRAALADLIASASDDGEVADALYAAIRKAEAANA